MLVTPKGVKGLIVGVDWFVFLKIAYKDIVLLEVFFLGKNSFSFLELFEFCELPVAQQQLSQSNQLLDIFTRGIKEQHG